MHTAVAVAVMNGRARRPAAVAHGAKAAPPHPTPRNGKAPEKDRKRPSSRTTPAATMKPSPNAAAGHGTKNRIQARRDRKIALQQDVEKLRKKLRHEENVHRALERAFTRPLGALPRLPPYLPSQTLELLAEVAVLEEEVVRLEEQVLGFRQGLYQEAIISSLAKSAYLHDGGERCTSTGMQNPEVSPSTARHGSDRDANWSSLNRVAHGKQTPRKPARSASQADRPGKENQSCTISNVPRCSSAPAVAEKCPGAKTGVEDDATSVIDSDEAAISANKVAEELLTCLLTIFSQMSMSSSGGGRDQEDEEEERASSSPSVSGSCDSSDSGGGGGDPYGVTGFGSKDVGPYKLFQQVDAASFHQNVSAGGSAILGRRLKALLRKLSSVDLVGLTHQQRLAFWINTYNSCMMNAFLEHGAPTTSHMLAAMMPKATINVGGRVLSAMTIEHSILRLPCVVTDTADMSDAAAGLDGRQVGGPVPIGVKMSGEGDGVAGRDGFVGLESPDPWVTFALSCGNWSSPAVRIYTAAGIEEELDAAKRDYLQAAMGVSAPSRLAIPKLLHWFMPDLTKDVSSLMEWACLQRDDGAVDQAVEFGNWSPALTVPYEFRFRYLLAW